MRKSISIKTAALDQIDSFADLMVAENAKHRPVNPESEYTPPMSQILGDMRHPGTLVIETRKIGGHLVVTA